MAYTSNAQSAESNPLAAIQALANIASAASATNTPRGRPDECRNGQRRKRCANHGDYQGRLVQTSETHGRISVDSDQGQDELHTRPAEPRKRPDPRDGAE
jgi:hypothetical protein